MESNDSKPPMLPEPSKEMEWKRSLVNLRKYENGQRKLIESAPIKIWKGDYETATTLEAFDSRGEEVFGVFGRVVTDGEVDGWKYQTIQREAGLPAVIKGEKVGKGFADVLYDGFVNTVIEQANEASENPQQNLQKFESAIEQVSQEVHIQYDKQDRPIKTTTYQEVRLKSGSPFPEKRLLAPTEEHEYFYDENGRILASTEYEFDETGEKKLSQASLYDYEEISTNHLRITDRSFTELRWKDIQDGAVVHSVTIRDIDPRDNKTLGYAVYETEDRRRGEILTYYEALKRNPISQRLSRETPPKGATWENHEYMPEFVNTPSYITGKDVDEYLKTRDITKIGTPGDQEREIQVLFPDEFVALVQQFSDSEVFGYVSKILSGDMVVELGMDFVKTLKLYQQGAIDGRMDTLRRVALLSTFLPMFSKQIRDQLIPKTKIDEIIHMFVQALAVDAKYTDVLDLPKPSPQMKNADLTIKVIHYLDQFSDIVTSQPEDFSNL